MQRWDLLQLDAPEGTRDPIVLHSDDGARAVLIVLRPGQSLGDHQVKENAWLTVLDGTVQITGGGETADAGPGTSRGSNRTNGGLSQRRRRPDPARARAVAGEGHYRGER